MGRAVNLYVRDADLEMWERFAAEAAARRLTISAAVMAAVEEWLAEHGEDA